MSRIILAGILILIINGPAFTQEPYEIDVKEGGEIFITDKDGEQVPFFGGSLGGKEDASALIPGATAISPPVAAVPELLPELHQEKPVNERLDEAMKSLEESLQKQAEELQLKEEDLQAFQEKLHEKMKEIQEELSTGAGGPKVVRRESGFGFGGLGGAPPGPGTMPGLGGGLSWVSQFAAHEMAIKTMRLSAPIPQNMIAAH